jgi:hypothetical protein
MTSVREIHQLACPGCGSDESLQVQITTMADLSADGTEPTGDHEWQDGSFIRCRACHQTGTVKDFTVKDFTVKETTP